MYIYIKHKYYIYDYKQKYVCRLKYAHYVSVPVLPLLLHVFMHILGYDHLVCYKLWWLLIIADNC